MRKNIILMKIFKLFRRRFKRSLRSCGSGLRIKRLQREKQELLASLELFYKVFFLNEEIENV